MLRIASISVLVVSLGSSCGGTAETNATVANGSASNGASTSGGASANAGASTSGGASANAGASASGAASSGGNATISGASSERSASGGALVNGDVVSTQHGAKIVFTNTGEKPVWAQTASGCAGIPGWFQVRQETERLEIVGNCITDCRDYDPARGLTVCPAVCKPDIYEELAPGGSIEFEWDGASWQRDPSGCARRAPVPAGTSLDVEFCVIKASYKPEPYDPPDPALVTCHILEVIHGAEGSEAVYDYPPGSSGK